MSKNNISDKTDISSLTEKMVLEYLQNNPTFLKKHPELLEVLVPPEQQMGDNVLDFQHYALNSLQGDMRDLKDKFNGLLSSARDNMSVQGQVQQTIMQLLKARDLEQLLEVLTIDMLRYFDVDSVRLIVESDMAEIYDEHYGGDAYSGISFVPIQTVDFALGKEQKAAMIPDTEADPPYSYEQIFMDCHGMIKSCALLRIYLDKIDRAGILAFGVREKNRFQPALGVELLTFLGEVVQWRLDQALSESEIERLL